MDEAQLLQCLPASLHGDAAVRLSAEAQLADASKKPGYGVVLARAALAPDVPPDLRQLAAVLLKQYVKTHWQDGGEKFEPPVVSDGDKRAIRDLLVRCLSDPIPKIQTAVGMAIASIATWDWPENWPSLLEFLVGAIKERKDPHLVQGALRCLSLFAGDIDEQQIPVVLPVLLPELKAIGALTDTKGVHMQRQSLAIIHTFISNLAMMSGQYQQQTKDLIQPHLEGLMQQFLATLSKTPSMKDTDEWGLQMEAMKSLTQIMLHFSRLVEPYVATMVSSIGNWLLHSYHLFVTAALDEVDLPEEGDVDLEGSSVDFLSLVTQLFELLLVMVGNKRYKHLFQNNLKDMIYLILGYMQMTQRQVNSWVNNPDQYLAEENEEMYTLRTSGELLLNELIEVFGGHAMDALKSAIEKRSAESASGLVAGNPNWWKPREAALHAFGCIADFICDPCSDVEFDLDQFLGNTLKDDVNGKCPFLIGRSLWVVSKLAPRVSAEQAGPFLQAAVVGLTAGNPPPIQLGACRAVSQLCLRMSSELLKPCLLQLLTNLTQLLKESKEDAQNLVLETLAVVVKIDEGATFQFVAQIGPAVLQIWSENYNDPMIGAASMAVITSLAHNPQCLPHLCQIVLPVVSKVMGAPSEQPQGSVEASLDLLTVLVQTRVLDVVSGMYTAIGPTVMQILGHSDDAEILQRCTKFLQAVVLTAGEQMLSSGGADPSATLQRLLAAVSRLLDPAMEDASAIHVGQLINALIQRMPNALNPLLPKLLEALVRKLQHMNMSQAVVSLLAVFCQLVHKDTNSLIETLAAMPAQLTDGSSATALHLVMSIWTDRYVEIQGAYSIRLSTTAMGLLLASNHPKLAEIQVRGRMVTSSVGVQTRSQARRSMPEQWVMVPLPVKLVMLLTDILVEQQLVDDDADLDNTSVEDLPKESERLTDSAAAELVALDDILRQHNSSDPAELDGADDLYDPNDPIARVDMVQYSATQIKELLTRDPRFLQSCGGSFSSAQEQVITGLLQKG